MIRQGRRAIPDRGEFFRYDEGEEPEMAAPPPEQAALF
jgi:hypothetical protein